MKNISIILLISFLLISCSFIHKAEKQSDLNTKNFIKNYRHYSFQWIFPEYFYKPEFIEVKKEKRPEKGYKKVNLFGLKSLIPEEFTHEIKTKYNIKYFKSKYGV